MWNCTELDRFVTEVHEVAHGGDVGVILSVSALCILGGVLMLAGEQLIRPLGGLVGGVGGAWTAFVMSAAVGMSCEARLITAGLVGVLTAAFSLFVLRTGIVVIGAGGLAAITHLAYDSLPISPPANGQFSLLGRSGYYYITMTLAVVIGGIASYVQRKSLLRIASSLLGGGCLALATFIVCERNGVEFPSVAGLAVLVVATLVGVGLQRWRARRRRQRRRAATDGDAVT